MKRSFVILLFIFLTKYGLGQTYSLVGAWNWSDSTNQTSLFFKKSGNMSMHSGPNDAPMLTKDVKKGKYVMVSNFLTVTWDDNRVEKNKIRFLNKNSFILTAIDKTGGKQKSGMTFRRIIDEVESE